MARIALDGGGTDIVDPEDADLLVQDILRTEIGPDKEIVVRPVPGLYHRGELTDRGRGHGTDCGSYSAGRSSPSATYSSEISNVAFAG